MFRYSTFVDTMKSLEKYAGMPDLGYKVKFVDVRINDIVANSLLSKHPPNRMRASYLRYILVYKLCIIDRVLLSLLEKLSTGARTQKHGDISPFGLFGFVLL